MDIAFPTQWLCWYLIGWNFECPWDGAISTRREHSALHAGVGVRAWDNGAAGASSVVGPQGHITMLVFFIDLTVAKEIDGLGGGVGNANKHDNQLQNAKIFASTFFGRLRFR